MEYLLQKAIEESTGHSYSPQQVAQIIDVNREAINSQAEAIHHLATGGTVLLILWTTLAIYAILLTYKFHNRLKKLEK